MRRSTKGFRAKVWLVFAMCAAMLGLPGCVVTGSVSPDYLPKSTWHIAEGITVSLAQSSYPQNVDAITLMFENRTDQTMLYGYGWRFEKLVRGKWQPVQTHKNAGFTDEGYTLLDYSKASVCINPNTIAKDGLTEGLYRMVHLNHLRVAQDGEDLWANGAYTSYQPYTLEFWVSEDASPEPEAQTSQTLGEWELPQKETWEWYTTWDILDMYERSAYTVWQCVKLNEGLVACLYREAQDDDLVSGDKLMLDICDRRDGARYVVFSDACVAQNNVAALNDGMIVRYSEEDAYREAFVSIQDGKLAFEPLISESSMRGNEAKGN